LKRKYGPDNKAPVMLLFVTENNLQGRTKMIEDGIMDSRWRQFRRNGTDVKEVAFSQRQTKLKYHSIFTALRGTRVAGRLFYAVVDVQL